ncbi:MAG: FAD-binding oxidoreductase [Thermodesulfobacteriota bacterium]
MKINIDDFIILLDEESVLFKRSDLLRFSVYDELPQIAVLPGTYEDVSKVIKYCNKNKLTIVPFGNGTKISLGNKPDSYDIALGMEKLNRIVEHNEIDFILTVQAGARLEDIQNELIHMNQFIALDPPHTEKGATIGGIISANDSGPSRLRYKTCKEQILEIKVVRADGEIIRGGAKVVKNVAGYDLPKLFVGSLGTLGIIVEATLRVYPVAEKSITYISGISSINDLNSTLIDILNADLVLTAFELTNRDLSQLLFQSAGLRSLNFPYTIVLRIENVSRAVDEQMETVRNILKNEGIEGAVVTNDKQIWDNIRNFPFSNSNINAVCKINVLVTDISKVIEYIEEVTINLNLIFLISANAGLGSIQISVEGKNKDLKMCLELLRSYVTTIRGSLVIQKLPDEFDEINSWGEFGSSSNLMKTLKANFDPNNILSPGRMI